MRQVTIDPGQEGYSVVECPGTSTRRECRLVAVNASHASPLQHQHADLLSVSHKV